MTGLHMMRSLTKLIPQTLRVNISGNGGAENAKLSNLREPIIVKAAAGWSYLTVEASID